ncbi:MAG: CocE/NonD family hydrolase [Deltaproteobacteria bacterium]|nr:CocE/NonD family hydrolase [Deltaproteobacteria bacterium]
MVSLVAGLFFLASLCGCAGDSPGDDDDTSSDDDDDSATSDDDTANDDDPFPDDDFGDDDTDDDAPGGEFDVMVEVRDGKKLWTKLYLPDPIPEGGVPTLVMRTPYRTGSEGPLDEALARHFANRGYAFLLQDVRGRGESEGAFVSYINEYDDGFDTIEWLTAQSYSNGDVGTIGGSYVAFTALAAAVDNPRVQVVIAEEVPAGESGPNRQNGVVSKGLLDWLYILANGDWMPWDDIVETTNTLDVAGADLAIVGAESTEWERFVGAPNPEDPVWSERVFGADLAAGICAPVLTVYSKEFHWMDPIIVWHLLRENGCEEFEPDQRIFITPDAHGAHTYTIPVTETPVNALMVDYIDKFLGGEDIELAPIDRVQYRAPSDFFYRSADEWPPTTNERTYYFDNADGAGVLHEGSPLSDAALDVTVDPAVDDPCDNAYPTLVYQTEPLASDLYIAGSIDAELFISSNRVDTDVFVDFMEYPALGDPIYITGGHVRARYRSGLDAPLTPAQIVRIPFETHAVAYRVKSGSRLAAEVRPAHCGFFENPHTGEDLDAQTHWETGTLTLHHEAAALSKFTVPFVP